MLYFQCFLTIWFIPRHTQLSLAIYILFLSLACTCNLLFLNLIEESVFVDIPEGIPLAKNTTVFAVTSKSSVNTCLSTLCYFMHSYIAFDRQQNVYLSRSE